MSRSDTERALRIELLQARAAVERAELANALHIVEARTSKARSVTAAIGGFSDSLRSAAPTVLNVLRVLREHPWLLSTVAALLARRPLKRLLALGIVAAALYATVGYMRQRGRSTPRR